MLARADTRILRLEEAHSQLQIALELYAEAGDRNGQAHAHLNAALVSERRCAYADALDHARTAVELFAALEDRTAMMRARNAVGWYHALIGDHAEALLYCQAALAVDASDEQAPLWDTLGYAHHKLGNHADAVASFQRAVDLYREIGDRHLEGLVLTHLAEALYAAGEVREAYATWMRALDILDELEPPAAAQIRIALAGLPAHSAR
jgi:tetratricopeptide (TPR) repeat protein